MLSVESWKPSRRSESSAASQIDQTAGVGRRPSGSHAPLDRQNVRSCLAHRRGSRRSAHGAEPYDDHVDRLVEPDLVDLERRDRLHSPPHVRMRRWGRVACLHVLGLHAVKVSTGTMSHLGPGPRQDDVMTMVVTDFDAERSQWTSSPGTRCRKAFSTRKETRSLMKTMTCRELGGPCDFPHHGTTADEVIKAQDRHLNEMVAKGDTTHETASKAMKGRWKHP